MSSRCVNPQVKMKAQNSQATPFKRKSSRRRTKLTMARGIEK